MTRSNVYAGPAGFWIIRQNDGGEDGLVSGTLPGPAPAPGDDPNFDAAKRETIREIPIVIQDRSFNADGSLFYPDNRAFFEGVNQSLLNVNFVPQSDISPIWNPEAFFNTMVVNGTTWPVLDVAQAKYRFRLLNGCNSRFLIVKMNVVNADGTLGAEIPFYQIGAEQSLLPNVVEVQGGLLMGLAERADVIVDFEGLPEGTRVRMSNIGPDEPFGGGTPGVDFPVADPGTTGQVMEFVIDPSLNGKSPTDPGGATPATDPTQLVLSLPDQEQADLPSARTRDLALLEEESQEVCVRIKPNGQIKQIRKVKPGPTIFADCFVAGSEPFGPKAAVLGWKGSTNPTVTLWSDDIVTNPGLGDTETWEFWNVSADAHPIHLHLVKFKVVGRGFDGTQPPEPNEAGWKDTVTALPGEVTRVKATFDIEGLYVWHCHIVEHEDNEMMVPYCVGAQDANGCQTQTFDPGA
jgi:FtsP/CotA-like multicopper oxidase with cupredoxin domain